MELKLSQYDEKIGKEEESARIKKMHILAFGVLFCSKSNVAKVHTIFDLFNTQGVILQNDEKFKEFLITLFLVANYGSVYARSKVESNSVGKMEKSEIKTVLNTCEIKDSFALLEETHKRIFSSNQQITYDEFKRMFTEPNDQTGIGFMLTPEGARKYQELYNV